MGKIKKKKNDPVSKELRAVEREIDNFYKFNPLVELPFAEAAWYLMAEFEEMVFRYLYKSNIYDGVLADTIIEKLKFPLAWLKTTCPSGGNVPNSYNADHYQNAMDLRLLAQDYYQFDTAYTWASNGEAKLTLNNNVVKVDSIFEDDTRYEYYNRNVRTSDDISLDEFMDLMREITRIDTSTFSYILNPRIVQEAELVLAPMLDTRYTLPLEWNFHGFKMYDFKKVTTTLIALAYIHFCARLTAISNGCAGLGYSNSLMSYNKNDLLLRLSIYAGCQRSKAENIIEMLTYGSMGIREPDPALQPLLLVNNETYMIMPGVLMCYSVERNFTVLLNRLPDQKRLYANIVNNKEELMRDQFLSKIKSIDFKLFSCDKTDIVPNVDLAIISKKEKICIIFELKWFIDPAEVRELIDRSKDLKRGVEQLENLQKIIKDKPDNLFERMGINEDYSVHYCLMSRNWIGMHYNQHPSIPIVRQEHLEEYVNSVDSWEEVVKWFNNREFLPIEGVDYKVENHISRIGKYGLDFYGLKPLR